jgi:spore coat protein A, manganese oxidase
MRKEITRREMLVFSSAVTAATLMGHSARAVTNAGYIPRFQLPLRVPPILQPVRADVHTDFYEIIQRQEQVNILPGKFTTIWGYDGLFPGPTIKAKRDRRVVIRYTNRLTVPTSVHLHGGSTASEFDGCPVDVMLPGESKTYVYENNRRAATLWYHDHAMHHTARNNYQGLAGFYLIEDEIEAALCLPSESRDIPLVIQDRIIGGDGSFKYAAGLGNQTGVKGNVILVNGRPWPALKVATRKYRFRILNASNSTPYRLALSNGQSFIQIGTDGGLLPAPVFCPEISLAMAERIEVVIDFSIYPLGTQILLRNLNGRGPLAEIMRFDVVNREHDDSLVPPRLAPLDLLDERAAVRTRTFVFASHLTFGIPPLDWTINGKRFSPAHPMVEAHLGDVEIWHFINHNPKTLGIFAMLHPVHVHLVNFQILTRNGGPPRPFERGWKDTVALEKGEDVRVIMKFENYRGRYLIHCHNLEHEDHSMMARFDVI